MIKDILGAASPAVIDVDRSNLLEANASWNMRGTALLQAAASYCGPLQDCYSDQVHLILLLTILCLVIIMMVSAFAFFREDKDEMFTPLTPQLVVKKEAKLEMLIPLDSQENSFEVTRASGDVFAKVRYLETPDPFRPHALSTCGVDPMVSIQSSHDITLALLGARNPTFVGQGLALCRQTPEDQFASIEPLSLGAGYHIKHRTGYPLMILMGEFGFEPGGVIDIQGFNKDGAQICGVKKTGTECRGWILQHVDAGLVIASLLAVQLQKRIQGRMDLQSLPPAPFHHEVQDESPPRSEGTPEEKEQEQAPAPSAAEQS